MKRYRVRLLNGRVIGPFEIKSFSVVVRKGKLSGREDVQEFPTGDWQPISEVKALFEILEQTNESNQTSERTYIQNIKELNAGEEDINEPENPAFAEHKEFKFEMRDVQVEDSEVLEEKAPEVNPVEEESDLDKTQVRKLSDLEDDKTKVNLDYRKYLEEQKKQIQIEEQKKKEEEAQKELEKKEEESAPDYENDKTQMFSIKEVGKELNEALDIELELEKDEKEHIKRKKTEEAKHQNPKSSPVESPKKKYRLYAIVGVALLALFLFDSGEETNSLKEIKVIPPKIEFPPRAVGGDPKLARKSFLEGLEYEKKQTYINDLKASEMYKRSMLNQYDNNPAASRLIFLYAKNLINSTDFDFDANKVYNLVQYFQDKLNVDSEYATAGAYFYFSVGKVNAALNILDRYKSIEGNEKTSKLFAVYLRALTADGNLIEAQKIADSLSRIESLDLFTLISLYEFSQVKSDRDESLKYIEYATANFPNSMYFLIEKAEIFLSREDLKEVRQILFRMNKVNVEGSKYFYSQYLKSKGFYHAQRKEFKKATQELKKSLKLFPDNELLGRLAQGQETENSEINKLFETSKSEILIKRSKESLRKDDIGQAFKLAVQAVDASGDNISARLNLANIQEKKGYYDDSLNQLETLYDGNRGNVDVQYALVDIYIEMYKFKEANQLLDLVENQTTERYASAKASLYLKKKDFNLANGWLTKAINLNKLNESNIFKLAKLRILYHKYDRAKSTLSKAMDLNPYNLEYKLSFAKILYEVENSKAAIGYLYSVLKDFPDNTRILSEIGIYYYRSGQIKNYKNIKTKIQELPGNANVLNHFLLESAKLDDDYPEIIKYCKKIIVVNPGDLETRLYLAQILMELKKYKESKKELEEIEKRFSTYPRLAYFNAKFYLLINNTEAAIALGEKEIKENPNVVDGYLLLGEIYQGKKDLMKARDYYQKAAQLSSQNVDAVLGLAFVAFHRDQYDMALDQYQKASTLDPNRAEIYKLLGDTYRKIGQGQIAVKNYKQYLELSPNSRYKRVIESYIKTME